MKLFSLLSFCLFLSFGTQKANAQVYKFRATSFSVMEKGANGKWGKWSDFEKSTVVITLDGKKDRVIVASHEIQLYKIISYGEKISNQYEDIIPLECIDNDGGTCNIQIITRKNQDNRMQFYINYDDVKFVYNIYNSK
jgi:hypothetical protein